MGRGFLSWMRTRGLMLAMLALVLRAALPAGFMLAQDAEGAPMAVLCTGHGPMLFDAETGALTPYDPAGHQDQNDRSPDSQLQVCPFAALTAAAPAPSPVALPLPRGPPSQAAFTIPALSERETSGPPLPARGPPLNA